MASRSKRRAKFLHRALKHHDCIRVERRIKKADEIEGYVVRIGQRWVLFAVPTDGSPDGFVALRIRDLKRAYWAFSGRFFRRSLQAQSAWPPAPPGFAVDLDHGVKRLVNSVAAGCSLVTIHPELDATDVCYVGRPTHWGRRKVRLHEVDPEGRWEEKPERHRTKAITRVDFGRVYETNLAVVAGKQPPSR